MGMTPLEGLVMGTRCGDIDPAVIIRLVELGMTTQDVDKLLNKKSGLLGVGGINSSDMRDIINAAEGGDQQALRALRMFVSRAVKYAGAYLALLDGADAIVFTGGIGEYSSYIRKKILDRIDGLGFDLDDEKNDGCKGMPGIITKNTSRCKAIVMPTNEELMIARETHSVMTHDPNHPHPVAN
jgi:acetate kinase